MSSIVRLADQRFRLAHDALGALRQEMHVRLEPGAGLDDLADRIRSAAHRIRINGVITAVHFLLLTTKAGGAANQSPELQAGWLISWILDRLDFVPRQSQQGRPDIAREVRSTLEALLSLDNAILIHVELELVEHLESLQRLLEGYGANPDRGREEV